GPGRGLGALVRAARGARAEGRAGSLGALGRPALGVTGARFTSIPRRERRPVPGAGSRGGSPEALRRTRASAPCPLAPWLLWSTRMRDPCHPLLRRILSLAALGVLLAAAGRGDDASGPGSAAEPAADLSEELAGGNGAFAGEAVPVDLAEEGYVERE